MEDGAERYVSGHFLKESIKRIIEEHVPSSKLTMKLNKRGVPCDIKTLKKITEKHWLRRKAIETKDPSVQLEYNKIVNQARILTRDIIKEYERGLAREAKENPKAIWKYIDLKSKTKEGIGNLLKDLCDRNSVIVETVKEKAEVLAEYFPVCSQMSPNPI